jgi:hypothetical protein
MTIYIDTELARWGGSSPDDLTWIDDTLWNNDEYETLSSFTDLMLISYAETHNGKTPTQWETQQ